MRTIRHEPPPSRVDNTCCPVCGAGISPRMPTAELAPHDQSLGLRVTIRIDSRRCADVARAHPDAHIAAARDNQVAHS